MDPSLRFIYNKFGIANITTDGFKLDTLGNIPFQLRIHSLSTNNTNFTIGIVFYLADIRTCGVQPALTVYLGSKLLFGIGRTTSGDMKFFSVISVSGKTTTTKNITVINALRNKTVICWLCKKQNLLKFDLSNHSAQSISTYTGATPTGNEITPIINSPYLKRIFYSPNFYDIDSEAYHKILIQEKLKGTVVL